MRTKVSVIVPVYNVEKYLRECVDSLLNQTLKEAEFIFVDDGSTDSSLEILKEYQAKDSRVQIYTQQNQFAGVARNNGFAHATGKYVIFLDSDDFFDLHMLKTCYEAAEKKQCEVLYFRAWRYDDVTKQTSIYCEYTVPKTKNGVFSANELFALSANGAAMFPWNKFVLSSYLRRIDVSFRAVPKCNDCYWSFLTLAMAERISYIPDILLYYRNNPQSTQGNPNKNMDCFLRAAMDIKEGLLERGLMQQPILKQAYLLFAKAIIHVPFKIITESSVRTAYYLQVKECLIPRVFETRQEASQDPQIQALLESSSLEDFLWRSLQCMRSEILIYQRDYISKQRIAYRVGSIILYIPLKIRDFLKSIR